MLPAGAGLCELQRRAAAVSAHRCAAPRQRAGQLGSGGDFVAHRAAHSPPLSGSEDSHPARRLLCASRLAGAVRYRARCRICGGDGQQCGPEAPGAASHAPGSPPLAPHRKDRACLRGNSLRRPNLAAPPPRHPQSRSGARARQGPQGQPAIPRHQPDPKPPLDLRRSVLPAGGSSCRYFGA